MLKLQKAELKKLKSLNFSLKSKSKSSMPFNKNVLKIYLTVILTRNF